MHSRAENYHIWAKHLLDESNGDGCSLIDHQQLSLGQLGVILRLDILDRLPVVLENIDTHHSVIKVRISRLQNVIVLMLTVAKSIKSFEKELEYCSEIFGAWSRNEDIAKTIHDSTCKSNTESS